MGFQMYASSPGITWILEIQTKDFTLVQQSPSPLIHLHRPRHDLFKYYLHLAKNAFLGIQFGETLQRESHINITD